MLRAIVLFCLAALAAGFQAPLASQVAVRSAAATSPAVYMGARKAAPKRKVAPKKKVARKVQLTPRAPRKSQPRPPFLYHRNLRPAAAGAATRLPLELPFFSHLSARRRRRSQVVKKAAPKPKPAPKKKAVAKKPSAPRKATGLGAGNDLFNGIGMAFQLLGSMGDSSKVTQAERSARTR